MRPGYGRVMGQHIHSEVDGIITTITIDRPEKKNAISLPAVLNDFIEAVAVAGDDPATSVVIVTGVPGVVRAGTDLSDLDATPAESRRLRGTATERRRWWPLVECAKPTVCAIDGPAVGMGAEFTSQCRPCGSPRPTPRSPGTSRIAASCPTPAPARGCCPG